MIHIHTDSANALKRVGNLKRLVKKMDKRMVRLVSWLLCNFSLDHNLFIHFVNGHQNVIADLLSRWACKRPVNVPALMAKGNQVQGH